jgi:hypothetical protein
MTKETYFEMCEALGSEPIESEIPIDFSDLPEEIQYTFSIYSRLRDEWDGFNGVYLGKNLSGILDIFTILDVPVEDRRTQFELISLIDMHRSNSLAQAKEAKKSETAK